MRQEDTKAVLQKPADRWEEITPIMSKVVVWLIGTAIAIAVQGLIAGSVLSLGLATAHESHPSVPAVGVLPCVILAIGISIAASSRSSNGD